MLTLRRKRAVSVTSTKQRKPLGPHLPEVKFPTPAATNSRGSARCGSAAPIGRGITAESIRHGSTFGVHSQRRANQRSHCEAAHSLRQKRSHPRLEVPSCLLSESNQPLERPRHNRPRRGPRTGHFAPRRHRRHHRLRRERVRHRRRSNQTCRSVAAKNGLSPPCSW